MRPNPLDTEWTSFQPAKMDHFSTGLDTVEVARVYTPNDFEVSPIVGASST